MVEIGEETGSVDEMLARTAERFESDLRRLINRALSLFEPAVIVFLGGFVGLIVIVMFSAIMKMRGTI
jgi:type II secretory pathway component PulF